jgi:hypothetical protein
MGVGRVFINAGWREAIRYRGAQNKVSLLDRLRASERTTTFRMQKQVHVIPARRKHVYRQISCRSELYKNVDHCV